MVCDRLRIRDLDQSNEKDTAQTSSYKTDLLYHGVNLPFIILEQYIGIFLHLESYFTLQQEANILVYHRPNKQNQKHIKIQGLVLGYC